MHFRIFIILTVLVSANCWAQGRKPAVEDFVGIEIEHPEPAPQGTESLVNLEKDIQTIHAEAYTSVKTSPKAVPVVMTETKWSVLDSMALVLILGLPLFSWLFVMNRLRKRASVESASNVEVLEKYRREREMARKKEEELRKAS